MCVKLYIKNNVIFELFLQDFFKEHIHKLFFRSKNDQIEMQRKQYIYIVFEDNYVSMFQNQKIQSWWLIVTKFPYYRQVLEMKWLISKHITIF